MTEASAEKVDFQGLVAGLATSAVAVLSQVEILMDTGSDPAAVGAEEAKPLTAEEKQKRVSDGLAGARHLIDMLAVLEEKTQGNLTGEEQELLQSAVSELRISYVGLSNRASG
jgi:hypothetical protein